MFITLYRHVYKDIKLTKEMKNENPKAGKTIILLSLLVFFSKLYFGFTVEWP